MNKDMRILVVDDEPGIRHRFVQDILEMGFQKVAGAVNGKDALRELGEEETGLVISDLRMPLVDGIELLTQMKGNPAYASIPFILMSSLLTEEVKAEAASLGAVAIVNKIHLQYEKLQELIKQTLGIT